jgi:hypothetical protein
MVEIAMVSHVVLMTPRPDLTSADRSEFVEIFRRALREIPSVRGVRIGRRIAHGAAYESLARDTFEFVAAIDFDDLAGLQAYLQHPAHQALGARFYQTLSSAAVHDFEMWGPEGLEQLARR